jgi:3-dehydroquinate synthase
MIQSQTFEIEGKIIHLNLELLKNDNFIVMSSPYNYSVNFVDDSALKSILSTINKVNGTKHFIYVDNNVDIIYKKTHWPKDDTLILNAIEKNKTINSSLMLIDKLNKINFTKEDIFISIGGGITQDISAFGRAIFKRGITWNYIPTTLLAMSDSCIGSKSAINYNNTKNLIGLFSAPHIIYINTDFLKTLELRDILSGYGEIIKLCIVGGHFTIKYFQDCTTTKNDNLLNNINQLIKISLLVKKSVIEFDEFENNIRKALNYGHTVGHAIEPLVDFNIPHGIAVMIGIIIENEIATNFGNFYKYECEFLNKIIFQYIDNESINLLKSIRIDDLYENMLKDKKNQNGIINFAIPNKIGKFEVIKISKSENLKHVIINAINNIINLNYK